MQEKIDITAFYSTVGERIKNKRERLRKSQEQLSMFLGFESRISIANIESGKQKVHVHTLVEIANYLKVPIEELLPPHESIVRASSTNPDLVKDLNKEGIADATKQKLNQLFSNMDNIDLFK